jgi:serine/threonine protein kinase
MAGFVHFLRCVGKAVVKHGLRGLAGLVPMGDSLYDIACDALTGYRRDNADEEMRAEIQALAQASPSQAKQAAEAVVRQVAADQPSAVQEALTAYLAQLPATVRQSLRRPADPTGTTVPATLSLRRAEDLLPFLPQRLPRFRPGDRPLAGVDRELVELLGTGGFGEVWSARNPYQQSAPVVALKFCLDEQAARALANEAELLDRVARHGRHPGLVALHQTYLSARPPCLEYEYVAGGDLAELVRERHAAGGMRPEEAARLMLQVARAVAFAHERGIVHRDLKPANILVARTAEGGQRLKVADFGIGGVVSGQALARAGGRSHTTRQEMTQALRGAYSPLYASPQQVRAGPDYRPDPRDDVYALGVIWYQLLTGDLTTGAPSGMSWVKELTGAGVPRSHVALMVACFEANPTARPADATDLAKRLAKQLNPTSPPVPRPVAPPPNAGNRPAQSADQGRSPRADASPTSDAGGHQEWSTEPTSRPFPALVTWGAATVILLCAVIGVTALALATSGNDTGRRTESTAPNPENPSGKALPLPADRGRTWGPESDLMSVDVQDR